MKILFDIGHPAHIHYFKNAIRILEDKGHEMVITARDKEITLYLIRRLGFKYYCTGKNLSSKMGKLYSVIRNDFKIYRIAKRLNPDLLVSFFLPFTAHVGKVLGKHVIGFSDTEHANISIRLTEPFTNAIVVPKCYKRGIPPGKKVLFDGYFELSYLHPNYFQPDPSILESLGVNRDEKYVIMRFVSWNASHDVGHAGLSIEMKHKAVKELSKYVKVFISSEGELPEDLKKYQIQIPPEKMHNALAFATLFVGEGATMASECAMLGTPAIYVNSLNAGTLEEQEKYELLFGFRNSKGVLEKAIELLKTPNLKRKFQTRRQKMLADKIDVTAFMVWFIENYPRSFQVMKENPNYQDKFKMATPKEAAPPVI